MPRSCWLRCRKDRALTLGLAPCRARASTRIPLRALGPCVFHSLFLAAALLAGDADGVEPGQGEAHVPFDWSASLARGLERERAGDLDAARAALLEALGLHPACVEAREALTRIVGPLHSSALERGQKSLGRKEPRKAAQAFLAAAELCGAKAASSVEECECARELRRLGWSRHLGDWVDADVLVAREKTEERKAARRLAQLDLGPDVRLLRREDLRIFTDAVAGSEEPAWARRAFALLSSTRAAYRALFGPVLARGPAEEAAGRGIDVVIFRDRARFIDVTGSVTTVGLYLPEREASFFFLSEAPGGERILDDTVVIHEVCHQLDRRVLGLSRPPLWLQEGLAVWFEGAKLSPAGRLEELRGLPPWAQTWSRALAGARARAEGETGREGAAGGDGAALTLREVLMTADVPGPGKGPNRLRFYGASAALVRRLLGDGPAEREALLDLVDRLRATGLDPEGVWGALRAGLERRGETLEGLEEELAREALTAQE